MNNNNAHGTLLAKNTIIMYVRMVLLTIIYFYTSRILLKELGTDDFGTFSLVASVVAMFESLKILFTSSTQRFLNYSMGVNDEKKLNNVFNTSLYINFAIALIFILLVEIVGLWFLDNKANILISRLPAAKFVFQMSLFTTVINIITTQYDAVVIAHEKMSFYAFLTLLDGILKLLIVLILPFIAYDSLIFYGTSLLIITLLIRIITILYCRKNYCECKLKFVWDNELFKQMTSFAGWQFLGNAAYTVTQNGLNMILNVFGSTVVNTARGIAYQVRSAVTMFLNNVSIVVNPTIIRNAAQDNKQKMYSFIYFASKVVFVLDALIIVPILFSTQTIVNIWLGNVPLYAVSFIQILLFNTLVSSLHGQLDTLFKAVGRLKEYQICECIFLLIPLGLSYLCMLLSMPYYTVFILVMLFEMIDMILIVFIAKKIASMNVKTYYISVVLPCFVVSLFIFVVWILCNKFLAHSFIEQVLLSIITDIAILLFMLKIGLNTKEKQELKNILQNSKFAFLQKFI